MSAVLLAAALFIVIQTFALLSPILLSLLLIMLITLAVNPVIGWIRAWTGGRRGATVLIALSVIAIIGLTGWAFSVPMKDSIAELTGQLPEYWERLQKPLIKMEQQAVNREKKLQAEVTNEIATEKQEADALEVESDGNETGLPEPDLQPGVPQQGVEPEQASPLEQKSDGASGSRSDQRSVRSNIGQMFQGVAGRFSAMALNAGKMFVVLVTVFFGVIFTLMNPRPIFAAIFSLVPERNHDQALVIMQRIGKFVPRWAAATLVRMMVIGLLVFFVMWPFFGFMDALVLGLIACVMETVPFIGPIVSAIPAMLLAFGEGGMTPLWVLLAYIVIQALESNVIAPMIMAKGMRLHPLAVVFSMLLCVAAFGVLGVLVAPPLVAVVGILHDELYRNRFLPTVTDDELDQLSRMALHERPSAKR